MNGVLPGPHSFPYRSIPKILLARVGSKVTSAIGKLLPSKQRQRTEYDAILAANRFRSFAPEREGNTVKWFVDGHDYLWAISEAIESAKSEIYILDWWLSPELYLRRPPELFPEWRLDALLKRKADQGVKIYVIVYNEVRNSVFRGSRLSVSLSIRFPEQAHWIRRIPRVYSRR
ncbi:hypothetical protein FRC18_004299 [Serendipita sp. 400]|nr:hypothetical protein FRC18_004299 [Serendipita sp. 400]